jgi:hypothetical protein
MWWWRCRKWILHGIPWRTGSSPSRPNKNMPTVAGGSLCGTWSCTETVLCCFNLILLLLQDRNLCYSLCSWCLLEIVVYLYIFLTSARSFIVVSTTHLCCYKHRAQCLGLSKRLWLRWGHMAVWDPACIGRTVRLEGTAASLSWCLVCAYYYKLLSVQETTGYLFGMY